jgi:hypothetical protein
MPLRHDWRPRRAALVDFGRKVGTIAGRSNYTALGIDADGNDDAAAALRAAASLADDFPTRQPAVDGEILLQPFRKCLPCASPCDFDRGTPGRIAQTHKSEVEVQCVDQHVDEPGGDGGRFSADPHSRDGRKCHEVSERCAQPQGVSLGTHWHWLVIIPPVRTGVAPGFRARTGQEEQRTDSPEAPLR